MLIRDLLPTLDRPNVRVLNILAAAKGGRVDVDDLDLKRTFSIRRCAEVTSTYSYVLAAASDLNARLSPSATTAT